ncbi:MAG: M20/M25/M40 family metallo-hydrolase [Planctomycetota bacterium]|nr:M20/M25/M40 family metallo-hydrolase [Planctomycetota bacterium]
MIPRATLPLALLLTLSHIVTAQEIGPVTGLPLQDEVVDSIWALEDLQVMDHLEELSTGIGPRLTTSENLQEACEWAADRFRSWGLKNVRLEKWGEWPVGFNRRISEGRMLQPHKEKLVFATMSWTAGTKGPSRGKVVAFPETEEALETLRGTLKNAWVLGLPKSPKFNSEGDDLRSQFGRLCDAEGIYGVIRATRNDLVLTGGNHRIDADDLPQRVDIRLRRDQARAMSKALEKGEEVIVEFDIENIFVPGPIPLYNVIAEIPGTETPEEMVIFGGHLDSWDGAQGTQDNGTGTATTLEAARILGTMGVQPKRTIRFMLWSGEEQGLVGSRAYIDQHPEENELISAVLVHDGGTNACSGINTTPMMMPMFQEVFGPIIEHTKDAEDEDLRFRIDPRASLPRGVGSDHDSYLAAGVPGFFWNQRGNASYNFVHHTQHDTLTNAVAAYEEHTSRVVAATAWRLANASTMVPRKDLSGPPPKRLGIFLVEGSLTVETLTKDGQAKIAGVLKGDTILQVGDTVVADSRELRRALRQSGETAEIKVQRGKEMLTFPFTW